MAKTTIAVVLAAAIGLGAAGCSQSTGPNEVGGTMIGAVAGGLLGSTIGGGAGKTAAIIGGTLIGGFLGNTIGRNMDENARAQAYNAQYAAVSSGQRAEWSAPSGSRGYVEPGPVYRDANGTCRRYTHTIYVDGRPQQGSGTACRNPDGSWQIVS
ncbi:glycine zipper domain-containing protein [Alsobacter sp. R-9]